MQDNESAFTEEAVGPPFSELISRWLDEGDRLSESTSTSRGAAASRAETPFRQTLGRLRAGVAQHRLSVLIGVGLLPLALFLTTQHSTRHVTQYERPIPTASVSAGSPTLVMTRRAPSLPPAAVHPLAIATPKAPLPVIRKPAVATPKAPRLTIRKTTVAAPKAPPPVARRAVAAASPKASRPAVRKTVVATAKTRPSVRPAAVAVAKTPPAVRPVAATPKAPNVVRKVAVAGPPAPAPVRPATVASPKAPGHR